MRKHKSAFDSAAVKKRAAQIGIHRKQIKEKYEAALKANEAEQKRLERVAKKKHQRGKWTGLLKGALMGAGGAALAATTGGASSVLMPALLGGATGAIGGYTDAATGSDLTPTGMRLLQMKMANDLAMQSPRRSSYTPYNPTGISSSNKYENHLKSLGDFNKSTGDWKLS